MDSEMQPLSSGQQLYDGMTDETWQEYDGTFQDIPEDSLGLLDFPDCRNQGIFGASTGYDTLVEPQLHQSFEQGMPTYLPDSVEDPSISATNLQPLGQNDYGQSFMLGGVPAQPMYNNAVDYGGTVQHQQPDMRTEPFWPTSDSFEAPWSAFDDQGYTADLPGMPSDSGHQAQSFTQHGPMLSVLPSENSNPLIGAAPCLPSHIADPAVDLNTLVVPERVYQDGDGASYSNWPLTIPIHNEHIASQHGQPYTTHLNVSLQAQILPTTIYRKRPRALSEANVPPSPTLHKVFETNVQPGNNLEIIPYQPLGTRGQFSRADKRTRTVDTKVAKACFTCRLQKRRCEQSQDGPCSRCQMLLHRLAQQIPIPKFTCDVRSNFAEINLFSGLSVRAAEEDLHGLDYLQLFTAEWADHIRVLLEPYVTILDLLEPHESRMHLWNCNNSLGYSFYIGILLKWKTALLYIAPGLRFLIGAIERVHGKFWRAILSNLDRPSLCPKNFSLWLKYHFYQESFNSWRHLDFVDQMAADHVQSYFKNRLMILTDIVYEELVSSVHRSQKNAKKSKSRAKYRAISLDELFEYWSLHACGANVYVDTSPKLTSQHLPCPKLDTDRQEFSQPGRRPLCFCSWVLDWLPIAYLQCFGYDAESFISKLHDHKHILHNFGSLIAPISDKICQISEHSYNELTKLQTETAAHVLRMFMGYICNNTSSKFALPWDSYCQTFDYVAEYDAVLYMLLNCAVGMASVLIPLALEVESGEPTITPLIHSMRTCLNKDESSKFVLMLFMHESLESIISERT